MIASAILNYYIIEVDYGRLELEAFFGRPMSKYYNDDNWSWEAEQAKQRDARQAIIDSAKQGMTYDKPCAHTFGLDDVRTYGEPIIGVAATNIAGIGDPQGLRGKRFRLPDDWQEKLTDDFGEGEFLLHVWGSTDDGGVIGDILRDGVLLHNVGWHSPRDWLGDPLSDSKPNKECPECKGDPQGVLLFSGYSPCSLCNSTND